DRPGRDPRRHGRPPDRRPLAHAGQPRPPLHLLHRRRRPRDRRGRTCLPGAWHTVGGNKLAFVFEAISPGGGGEGFARRL
ncbi:MAG: hypothetical protein AVDCRST_MAG19-482, partial [uncultured Thermomicrobiales bacterium]